ncbi:MAG: hypothetical protein LBR34_12465 [Prevotella sp.]|nr:hypothetical protein [Prevotella sp.]
MMKTVAKIAGFLLLVAAVAAAILQIIFPTPESFNCGRLPVLIAHAGGAINGKTYTNAMEAVELSVRNDYRFIELDLDVTAEGHIAAVHYWNEFHIQTGCVWDTLPLLSGDFKSRKIQDSLHPLSGGDIGRLFPAPLYLVTDKIADYNLINKEISVDKNRLLVECFSYRNYRTALQYGIKYPMLNIQGGGNLLKYAALLFARKVKIITVPIEMLTSCGEALACLHRYGIIIFAYTSNDRDFILKHSGKTVSGFYTDSVTCMPIGSRTK